MFSGGKGIKSLGEYFCCLTKDTKIQTVGKTLFYINI